MNILCFSDLHRDRDAARLLVDQASDVDLVIGAGDFANRHQGLADTLDILSEIGKPAVLVPGNGETFDELRDAAATWKSATVLHGSGCTVHTDSGAVAVWGVGGGIPVTPFGDWSYDFDEQQASGMLDGCQEFWAHGDRKILVVHSPPIDTVDHDSSGRIRGSQAIRDCVERCQPNLVVCGHIHSDWEKQTRLNESVVLNAGPRGVMIRLG
ncbi:metallophosphoesterase family protein [Neorhodopirellula pilleata]|uniref:Calcineurin-like phosphoesterase superfamily domain protein n=1 Tax=Neorhodopirellula pilleata TaxID=2714738 RepID=A0A5C6AQP9_9BACT|nr:metallophosphoesterase [Neorhodopirellula pilleata]TWU01791.1 Calcineurin-like phosphoesterase superfamily domain protein [Neorhodopirellula pilleata]